MLINRLSLRAKQALPELLPKSGEWLTSEVLALTSKCLSRESCVSCFFFLVSGCMRARVPMEPGCWLNKNMTARSAAVSDGFHARRGALVLKTGVCLHIHSQAQLIQPFKDLLKEPLSPLEPSRTRIRPSRTCRTSSGAPRPGTCCRCRWRIPWRCQGQLCRWRPGVSSVSSEVSFRALSSGRITENEGPTLGSQVWKTH